MQWVGGQAGEFSTALSRKFRRRARQRVAPAWATEKGAAVLPAPCPRASLESAGCRAVPGRRGALGVARGQARRLWAVGESLAASQLGFRTGRVGVGARHLVFGTGRLRFRADQLGFETGRLGFGARHLVFGTSLLEFGTVYIEFGIWLSGFGTSRCSGTGVAGKLSG